MANYILSIINLLSCLVLNCSTDVTVVPICYGAIRCVIVNNVQCHVVHSLKLHYLFMTKKRVNKLTNISFCCFILPCLSIFHSNKIFSYVSLLFLILNISLSSKSSCKISLKVLRLFIVI